MKSLPRRDEVQASQDGVVHIWRHPKAMEVAGRCMGHTDAAVMPRKVRRLAYRIQSFAGAHRLQKRIWTSDLQRSHCVGRVLASWGWEHVVDPGLREACFGRWDGMRWIDIPRSEIDAWSQDLMHYAPGGGESVVQLLDRVAQCLARLPAQAMVVGHGGWISAASWCTGPEGGPPAAASWPRAPKNNQLTIVARRLRSPHQAGASAGA